VRLPEIWDSWVPGVLSRDQVHKLCENGLVSGVSNKNTIDHSSLDLHVTDEVYHLVKGSVKPFGEGFLREVTTEGLARRGEPDSAGQFPLLPKNTYLFCLRERLDGLRGKALWGQATAKSSVGRLDVLARLIVDGMKRYEGFTPEEISTGRSSMFLEVTPITFPVLVRPGISLSQLRLFYGSPDECELKGPEIARTCLAGQGTDHHLTVDLTTVEIIGVRGCGFRARTPSSVEEPIPLWTDSSVSKPDPSNWWELVRPDAGDRIRITKNHFYILRSKERLTVPPGVAVYARAIDEEIGEMRIHYAGFAHPLFGWSRGDALRGTPLIFEVRGHDVDVSLRNREILARLKFFRMSEDAPESAQVDTSYNEQNLKLSKCFAEWSTAPRMVDDES